MTELNALKDATLKKIDELGVAATTRSYHLATMHDSVQRLPKPVDAEEDAAMTAFVGSLLKLLTEAHDAVEAVYATFTDRATALVE